MSITVIASYIQDDKIINNIIKVAKIEEHHLFMLEVYKQLIYLNAKSTADEQSVQQSIADICNGVIEDSDNNPTNIIENIMIELKDNYDSIIFIKDDNIAEILSNNNFISEELKIVK